MSTKLFLSNMNAVTPWLANTRVLSTQQGNAVVVSDANITANGPSSGIQVRAQGSAVTWFTAPLQAGIISGTMNFNLWGYESNSGGNVGWDVAVDLVDGDGNAIAQIIRSEQGIELGTSAAAQNWSDTPASSVAVTAGDRIRVRVHGNDAGGTMAASRNFFLYFGAGAGLQGDSYIQFAEDLALVVYPTPLQDGPQYLKFLKLARNYEEITVRTKFEDGGVDILEHADTAPRRYEFTYDGLTDQDVQVLDDFWDDHRLSGTFTLIEPRDSPWTGVEGDSVEVRFESFKVDHNKVWTQSRQVVLVEAL